MGCELVRQLVAEGCPIAVCDVSARGMAETQRLCEAAGLPQGLRVTSHVAEVSNEADVLRFRDEVSARHMTDRIHLVFNSAGISGGGSTRTFAGSPSLLKTPRVEADRPSASAWQQGRWYDMAASVDRGEYETMFGSNLDCCLDVTGYD